MRIKNKYKAVCSLARVRFFNARVPLAVRWQLTNRCVLRCQYCNVWKTPGREMSMDRIIPILDEMAALGTQTISYSGGEPMLHADIFQILQETKKRGISTEMNSTGAGIPENISRLQCLDFLKISLDGPEDIHDQVRGRGSFKMAMAAAHAARDAKLRFIFSTTLTKYNIKETPFLQDTAKKFDTLVALQPLKGLYRGVEDVASLEPCREDHLRAVGALIGQKKKGPACLRNSLAGLEHIYHWPQYPPLQCWAGKIFCILSTDGTLMPCDRIAYAEKLPNCLEAGFARAFAKLPAVHCSGCGFCGVLELNFLMSYKWGTLKSLCGILK
ncbi:MAG: radical SAM protein [Candidatus Omnitrophica bacterium]|nr:radical SAM protein [Candidatus Omnitrophota bacterium]